MALGQPEERLVDECSRLQGVVAALRPHVVPCQAVELVVNHGHELPSRVAGSELFLCECTQVTRDYPFHLSLEELSERRDEFDCGRLLLTHLGPAMRARKDFDNFDIADDGMRIRF